MELLIILILVAYFLPTLIATIRGTTNVVSVFFINFILGWSVIGWFLALFMASSSNTEEQVRESRRVANNQLKQLSTIAENVEAMTSKVDSKVCPRCAETVKKKALVCRYCGYEFEEGASNVKQEDDPEIEEMLAQIRSEADAKLK